MAKSTTGSVASGAGGRNGRGMNVLGQPMAGSAPRRTALPSGVEPVESAAGTFYRAAGTSREFDTPELAQSFASRVTTAGEPARNVRQARQDAAAAERIAVTGRNDVSVVVAGERHQFRDRDLADAARYIQQSAARERAAKTSGDVREAADAGSDLAYSQDMFRDRLAAMLARKYRSG